MGKVAGAKSSFERRLGPQLGGKLGDLAVTVANNVEATKTKLRQETALMIHPLGNGSPKALNLVKLDHDGTFYLLHNHFRPPNDPALLSVLDQPDFELVERREFRGLTLYKLRTGS